MMKNMPKDLAITTAIISILIDIVLVVVCRMDILVIFLTPLPALFVAHKILERPTDSN